MDAFTLAELEARRAAGGDPYLEFLTVPDLSAGLYVLDAGAVDRQQPHTEDEVYVILAGRSRFTAGDETRDVGPGRHAVRGRDRARTASTTSSRRCGSSWCSGRPKGSRATG